MSAQKEYDFSGFINDSYDLQVDHKNIVKRLLTPWRGKKLLITISILEEKRSTQQNRWYWGAAIPTIMAWRKETTGETLKPAEVHFYNLIHVCGRKPIIKEVMGIETIIMEGKTTSQMTIREFMEFKEALQSHYAEKDCEIPDPRGNNLIQDFIQQ